MYITNPILYNIDLGSCPPPTDCRQSRLKERFSQKWTECFAHSLWVRKQKTQIYIYIIIHTYLHTYIALHYMTLRSITLHYITLHYIALHCITLHYITLHYITLHYIALHYIHTHTHIYMYAYIYIYICTYTYINTSQWPKPPSKEVSETAVPLISWKPSKSGEFCRLRCTSPVKWEDRIR